MKHDFAIRKMVFCLGLLAWAAIGAFTSEARGADESKKIATPIEGEVNFEPAAEEAEIPELFRMEAAKFKFEQSPVPTVSKTMTIWNVRFPSPIVTPHENNNTVHLEYFRPVAEGKRPAVVVLHILGGDFDLSRLFCRQLAHNGVAALFLVMPYYGPRRQPDIETRMISIDPRTTVAGMRQAVADIRWAAAWLGSRDEIDAERLGIFGISLGGITASLAATVEPKFRKICPMLAGANIGKIAWERRQLRQIRESWLAQGGTEEEFMAITDQINPALLGDRVRDRKILMLNATDDEVIPRECTDALWNAFGQPEIVWYDAGHTSAIIHIFDGLARVTRFFVEE